MAVEPQGDDAARRDAVGRGPDRLPAASILVSLPKGARMEPLTSRMISSLAARAGLAPSIARTDRTRERRGPGRMAPSGSRTPPPVRPRPRGCQEGIVPVASSDSARPDPMRVLCLVCAGDNSDTDTRCTACGSPLPEASTTLLRGTLRDPPRAGRGGMGRRLSSAVDRVLDETVAIKGSSADRASPRRRARRFRSEIKLARKVTHRNVCRIHDYGEDGGLALHLDAVRRGRRASPADSRRGRPPPDEACAIAVQIADGLQAIHDEGIVHRDLKPANVMMDRQRRRRGSWTSGSPRSDGRGVAHGHWSASWARRST